MSIIQTLHQAMIEGIQGAIPVLQTVSTYPRLRNAVEAPAVFVELASLEPGTEPGTGECPVIARFEARIVVGSLGDDAALQVRTLAAQLLNVLFYNTWGLNISPAKFVQAGPDAFNPELDAYEVWLVEWTHELHLGQSVWEEDNPSTFIPEIIYVGFTPNVGLANSNDYTKIEQPQC